MTSQENNTDLGSSQSLQFLVFTLVCAAFTTVYITQPVLPILREEFGVDAASASLSISAVVFGIALANLPFGRASDRFPVKPLIFIGGMVITACGLVCAFTTSISVLIATRFVQGLFMPCLTTCVAAYLAKTLPKERLNVVLGSYISAQVAGGLGGRLLGGFIHPPLHWRYAFVSASVFLAISTVAACIFLPPEPRSSSLDEDSDSFVHLLLRPDLLRIFVVAFAAFSAFSSTFNYLPFYLSLPPFNASTEAITLMYVSYLFGILIGPLAGKLSNRIGNGATMTFGAVVFAISIWSTLIQSMTGVAVSLAGICVGFFSIHASAAGSLNNRLESSRGRANSLYVLFYYLGGFAGISLSGYVYQAYGWSGMVAGGTALLLVPFVTGLWEVWERR